MFLAKETGTPWNGFTILSQGSKQTIDLRQQDDRHFQLASTIEYTGNTGLGHLNPDDDRVIRTVSSATLGPTDLASVPAPFRWWTNSYGLHTPAALIHDRFIGTAKDGQIHKPEAITEQQIDRYFRFMLNELGVPFYRRWLLWTAVASRTRFKSGPLRFACMLAWIACVGASLVVGVQASVDRDWMRVGQAIGALGISSAWWGRQAGAGLIIAFVGIPFLLAPSLFALPFILLYALLEALGQGLSKIIPEAWRHRVLSIFSVSQLGDWLRRTWDRITSTEDHATLLIRNKDIRRRYQARRSVIAVAAAVFGGIGLGITKSSTGGLNPDLLNTVGYPTAIVTAIALVFIWVRVAEIFRWLALLTVVLWFLFWKDGLQPEVKIGVALLGALISFGAALALRFGIAATTQWFKNLGAMLRLILLIGLGAGAVLAQPKPAVAQGLATCANEQLLITTSDSVLVVSGDDTAQLDLRVPHGGTSFTVAATSAFEFGTVSVVLLETRPIPMISVDEAVVWVGRIGESGSPHGQTPATTLTIRRRPGNLNYSMSSSAHEAPLHLMAGEGLYQATFTDAGSDQQCILSARIRILAPPTATPIGLAGLGAAVLGLGALGGLARVGGSHVTEGSIDVGRTYEAPDGTTSKLVKIVGGVQTWQITAKFQPQERRHDLRSTDPEDLTLLSLVRLGGELSIAPDGWISVPLTVVADQGGLKVRASEFSVGLRTQAGQTLVSQSFEFDGRGFGVREIDLRPLHGPDRPVAATPSADTDPSRTSASTVIQLGERTPS